jgi:photosystem II stability/assembly factor-like uncharacterized protein
MLPIANFCRLMYPLVAALLFYSSDLSPWWSVQTSGLDTNLRGVGAQCLDHKSCVIWASGSNGVILRSNNDGKTWKQLPVAGGGDLDFRDIEAFGTDIAYVMSSGESEKSRIYKTTDDGEHWTLQYSDKRPGFFLDSLACDSPTHCVAISDPVDGKFLLIATEDGEHWKELSREHMPAALPQEGAFAASGTAVALCDGKIFFGTGGPAARIFSTRDRGNSWMVVNIPMAARNPSSGVFSVACVGPNLVAVGGDYKDPDRATEVAAYSNDSGQTWQLSATQPSGYRSAVATFSDHGLIAVGPNGVDVSHDEGVHWQHEQSLNLNAVRLTGTIGWAVGPKGTVVRIDTKTFQIKK